MKISVVCHGNVARSQVLHHYLRAYADEASLSLDLFSCGTAPLDAYPDIERMLAEVQDELSRRGLEATVKRNILDDEARQHLVASDVILIADSDRKQEVIALLGEEIEAEKVLLFYEFIDEGQRDFTDTYDADRGAQDPELFAKCFDELERIAKQAVAKIKGPAAQPHSEPATESDGV